MAVNPMMGSGAIGIHRGLQGVSQSVEDIAHLSGRNHTDQPRNQPAPADEVRDTAEALVSMRVYERQVQASAKVVQTAEAVVGMLLDTQG